MKPQRLDKMSEGRWSAIENDIGPRYTAIALIVLLLAYWIVGML